MKDALLRDPESFKNSDYHDKFELTAAQPFDTLDDFVERLALNQPGWLTRLSMGISGEAKLKQAAAAVNRGDGQAIGNWKVIGRTDDSITLAEDMRVMRYRLTYTLTFPNQVTAETEVVQQTRWFGPIYWALATPMHRRFLQLLLRNSGGTGSQTSQVL